MKNSALHLFIGMVMLKFTFAIFVNIAITFPCQQSSALMHAYVTRSDLFVPDGVHTYCLHSLRHGFWHACSALVDIIYIGKECFYANFTFAIICMSCRQMGAIILNHPGLAPLPPYLLSSPFS